MKKLVELFKETFSQWNSHEAPRMGAALAFYSILSLAPLIILAVGICALVFGAAGAQAQLLSEFRAMVGDEGARAIEAVLQSAQKPASGVLASVFGLVTLLFGASGVLVELRAALNKLWEVEPANGTSGIWAFVKDRFLSFGMVLAIGFLLLISLAISASLGAAGKFLGDLGFLPPAVWEVVNFVVSLAVVSGMFALIFRFVPNVRLPWRNVLSGGALTAVLFTLGKTGIGIYLGKAGVGSAWGAAGSLVVLVVWIYYSAQIFFFGAMFTHVYAEAHGWLTTPAPQPISRIEKASSGSPRPQTEMGQKRSPSIVAKVAAACIIVAALFRRGTQDSKGS